MTSKKDLFITSKGYSRTKIFISSKIRTTFTSRFFSMKIKQDVLKFNSRGLRGEHRGRPLFSTWKLAFNNSFHCPLCNVYLRKIICTFSKRSFQLKSLHLYDFVYYATKICSSIDPSGVYSIKQQQSGHFGERQLLRQWLAYLDRSMCWNKCVKSFQNIHIGGLWADLSRLLPGCFSDVEPSLLCSMSSQLSILSSLSFIKFMSSTL